MAWTSFDKPAKMYKVSSRGGANNETKIHPTQKPVKIYKMILRDFADQGFTILDTHLGSGSNRIACFDAGIDFTAFELDKIYFNDQEKRFQNHIKQLTFNF